MNSIYARNIMSAKRMRHVFCSALTAALLCIHAQTAVAVVEVAIESGQYCENYLDTWWNYGHWFDDYNRTANYYFYAQPRETVIIRLGHEEHYNNPLFAIYNPGPDGNSLISTNNYATWTTNGTAEYYLTVTNTGWYTFVCSLPTPIITNVYTNIYTRYNCSMLRIPNIPLSYQDPQVGTLPVGDSKVADINVSADLDAGFVTVTNNRTTLQIRMGQLDFALVPNIQVYDPNGTRVTNDFPTDYRSEITSTLTNNGVYTVVCSDKFNAKGQYALTMVTIPGTLNGADLDIGTIISGEKKTGTINQPGDLDLASFGAVTGDIVNIIMRDVDLDLNPVMEFYGPAGERLARVTDPLETCAAITNYTMTNSGVFSVICKDKEDRKNVAYTLEMYFSPGSPSLANIPAAPETISASKGAYSNRIDVTWAAADGATGYDLWRSYSTNSADLISTNITAVIYADYGVTSGIHYYYKVKSRNTYGTSSNFSPTAEGYCGIASGGNMRRVILVGIDNYSASYGPSPLLTCTNDAYGMLNIFFLGDPSNRWASTNMTVYTDRQATKLTIQSALNALASSSSAGDIAVYVHSSHGGTSGTNTYICTYDANYTAAELGSDLSAFNSETTVIVIIDACYSGGMFKGLTPPPWRFAEETLGHYRLAKAAQMKSRGLAVPKELGNNIAFMTACDYNELSYCSDYYSRYIGYLIKGCSVQSVDTNSNGQYNFLELHNYAATQSAAETPTQTAQSFHPSKLEDTIARDVGTNEATVIYFRYNDFDGDGVSDLAVYNSSTGGWRIGSLAKWTVLAWDVPWGGPGYRPLNGDYDNDRATDLAVYNESHGIWSIASLNRRAVIVPSASFGGPNLTPVSGDFNGDRFYDGALYQHPEGFWYIVTSIGVPLIWGRTITGMGFIPVSGDYDGDHISDLAMYNTSAGYWYIISVSGNVITWATPWGGATASPVSGDYDGDAYSDLAVYQESTGLWYIWSLKRSALIAEAIPFGGPGFTPVPGDYNGDGKADLVLYQESLGLWHLRTVSSSASTIIPLGGPGYIPVLPAW